MLDYPRVSTGKEKKEYSWSIHLRIPEFLSVPEMFKHKGSQRVVLLLPNGRRFFFYRWFSLFVSLLISYFTFRYTVNELGRWEMEFGIHVKTYDQVTTKVGNITKPKWVPGGEIVIGPHVRMGRGKYGRVSQWLPCISQLPTLVDLIHFANQRIGNRWHKRICVLTRRIHDVI